MKALDNQARTKKAKLILPNMLGTYRLYRRHSMLPGVLREHFVIDTVKDGHCEGTYIQFARAHPDNIIPFNVFFCEFYVIAFGAHQAVGKRTEIVTVSVLIDNAFSGESLIPCDDNKPYYVGLLSGIYDSGNVLLAERVLIERITREPLIRLAEGGTRLETLQYAPALLDADRREHRDEYRKAVLVIDNALDARTLAVRLDHIELVGG